tara:strand:- start:541 stop:1455 length:915 start_codon:yes stop_codon:yes gene_type:complete
MKMTIKLALNKLKLDNKYSIGNINELTHIELKRTYHIMALNYHPDKNPDPGSNERFQEILAAYSFLSNIINSDTNVPDNSTDEEIFDAPYTELIINLLTMMLKNPGNDSVHNFQKKCIEFSNKIFDQLFDTVNIDVLEDIYRFINNNTMNFPVETIDIIKNIIDDKLRLYNIYILTPSLDNILNSEIFKLEIGDETIYVPLWHQEMMYEKNIIKIQPVLTEGITIYENNDIHIEYSDKFENVLNLIKQDIETIDVYRYKLDIHKLSLKKNQTYTLKNEGIPVINSHDIFDNKSKANVVVHIRLE